MFITFTPSYRSHPTTGAGQITVRGPIQRTVSYPHELSMSDGEWYAVKHAATCWEAKSRKTDTHDRLQFHHCSGGSYVFEVFDASVRYLGTYDEQRNAWKAKQRRLAGRDDS